MLLCVLAQIPVCRKKNQMYCLVAFILSIIGGADGPTKIFLSGNFFPVIAAAAVLAVILTVLFVIRKKRK